MNSEALLGISAAARDADRALLLGGDEPARLVGDVLDARGDDGAAMDAGQQALLAKIVEVLADRLRRHVETAGQLVDADAPLNPGESQDFLLPGCRRLHGSEL